MMARHILLAQLFQRLLLNVIMHSGLIYVVDDDNDDRQFIQDVASELQWTNKLMFFSSASDMLDQLATVQESPFIILSDVNLPGMDGFELREAMLNAKKKIFKSVPFIFWSTVASTVQVQKAFDLSVHGFFIKPSSYQEMKLELKTILQYWQMSRIPPKVS